VHLVKRVLRRVEQIVLAHKKDRVNANAPKRRVITARARAKRKTARVNPQFLRRVEREFADASIAVVKQRTRSAAEHIEIQHRDDFLVRVVRQTRDIVP